MQKLPGVTSTQKWIRVYSALNSDSEVFNVGIHWKQTQKTNFYRYSTIIVFYVKINYSAAFNSDL